MRSGTFNLSIFFWIWLICGVILGLKINSVSSYDFETEPGRLKIPALGRTSYGIGSLYDGRTGNFLPLDFSAISEKSRLLLDPQVISRVSPSLIFNSHDFPLYRPSGKLSLVFEKPTSSDYDMNMGSIIDMDYDGLALRAVLGLLEFPENGTAGVLLDKLTQQEMSETITKYTSSASYKFEDELILPETGTAQSPHDKLLRREIRRNMKRMDIKILKKATHVVVKVIRGSKSIKSSTASSFRIFSDDPAPPADFTSTSILSSMYQNNDEYFAIRSREDLTLSPSTPEGVLSFELMPLLHFLNKSGLELTPSSHQKFLGLEDSIWRNPMEIRHGRTFHNLDWSWQLIRQMAKLNTTLHQCLKEKPGKDEKKAGEMIQELQNLYENLTEKLTTYKRDLKSLLEKSSTGTEQDEKLWDSIYEKEWRAVGTGVHWNFYRVLECIQKKVFLLGGENNNEIYSFSKFWEILNTNENGVKTGCDAIPEIA